MPTDTADQKSGAPKGASSSGGAGKNTTPAEDRAEISRAEDVLFQRESRLSISKKPARPGGPGAGSSAPRPAENLRNSSVGAAAQAAALKKGSGRKDFEARQKAVSRQGLTARENFEDRMPGQQVPEEDEEGEGNEGTLSPSSAGTRGSVSGGSPGTSAAEVDEDDAEQEMEDEGFAGPSNPYPQIPELPTGRVKNYVTGNQLSRSVTTSGIGKRAEAKAAGRITSQAWWYGYGLAQAVFFTGLDFMLGAVIMDAYWLIFHRKDKDLFPMKFWQKAVTVFANIAPLLYLVLLFGIIMLSICNSPVYKTAIFFTGQAEVCKSFDASNWGALGSVTGTGTAQPGPSCTGQYCTSQWDPQIRQAASQYGVDACILKTVIQKESAGNPQAIGYDRDPNRGSFQLSSPPKYNLDWNYSHGIGLTQWTIFPVSGSNAWVNADTPSRKVFGSFYTVADFLSCNAQNTSPCTSLLLTAQSFSINLSGNGNNLRKAFGDYNGSGEGGQYAEDSMRLYNLCKGSGTYATAQ